MTTSYVKETVSLLIEESKELPKVKKSILKKRVENAISFMETDIKICEIISSCMHGSPIIEDYREFDKETYIVKTSEDRYWRTVFIEEGNASSKVSESYEEQLLITFGLKYDGLNSQFSDFAARMLGDKFFQENDI